MELGRFQFQWNNRLYNSVIFYTFEENQQPGFSTGTLHTQKRNLYIPPEQYTSYEQNAP
jgi:hypothetical protein